MKNHFGLIEASCRLMLFLSFFALFGNAYSAVTNVFHVPEGQTLTVDEIVAANGYSFSDGDWISKTGGGQLNAVTTYKNVQLNLLIKEGVYFLPNSLGEAAHTGGSEIIIKSGATLNIEGGISQVISNVVNVVFEGDGTGEGDNLGAIAIGGSTQGYVLGSWDHSNLTMTDNATVYSYGDFNCLIGGKRTLNMNGHTLTVRGKNSTSAFYPYNDWFIQNTGPFIFKNGVFARRQGNLTDKFSPFIPVVHLTDNASLTPYRNPSIWDQVDLFDFEYGTKISDTRYRVKEEIAFSLNRVKGPVTICNPYAPVVSIINEYIVDSSDLIEGKYLNSQKEFVFGEKCELSIVDYENFIIDPDCVYTVAVSNVGITGVPELVGEAASFLKLVKEDKVLALKAKEGSIDAVRYWGLKTGVENAEANSLAVAANKSKLIDESEIYFRGGEYWFSGSFDLSDVTISNLVLTSEGAIFHSGISLGASKDVKVQGFLFDSCEGPAVSASGTDGLLITDCVISNVVGQYTNGKKYIYAAVDVNNFNATQNTYWFDEMNLDGQGYFEGGSQHVTSEAYADSVVVKSKEIGQWVRWASTTNLLGLSTSAFNGKMLRKIGVGTIEFSDVNVRDLGISGVHIVEGRYISRDDSYLGVSGYPVYVHNGGILQMRNTAAKDRTIYVSGNGYNNMGAIRFDSGALGIKSSGVTWVLEGDAMILSTQVGENLLFSNDKIYANGHTLTFRPESTKAGITNVINGPLKWYGGGVVKVRCSTLSSVARADSFVVEDGSAPRFVFESDAVYAPANDDVSGVIKNCHFEEGAVIAPKSRTSLTFGDFSGFPTAGDLLSSILINGCYRFELDNVLSGKIPVLSCPVAFGPLSTWAADRPKDIPYDVHELMKSAEILSSPKRLTDEDYKDLRVFRLNTQTLCVGPRIGSVVVFR